MIFILFQDDNIVRRTCSPQRVRKKREYSHGKSCPEEAREGRNAGKGKYIAVDFVGRFLSSTTRVGTFTLGPASLN